MVSDFQSDGAYPRPKRRSIAPAPPIMDNYASAAAARAETKLIDPSPSSTERSTRTGASPRSTPVFCSTGFSRRHKLGGSRSTIGQGRAGSLKRSVGTPSSICNSISTPTRRRNRQSVGCSGRATRRLRRLGGSRLGENGRAHARVRPRRHGRVARRHARRGPR